MLSTLWWVLAALAVILAVRVLADRSGQSPAVLLVLAGLAVSLLPVPSAELEPHLILEVVIPPLLFVAARDASLLELRANARIVASLSVALVLLTAFAVATGLSLVVSGLSFAAALALGAAVAPPDPVASLAIGRRAGMPARLIALVEGEGLLNDGTALTIYGLAVTAAVGGGFSATESVGRFALAVVGGALCGLLVARALALALRYVDDILVENAASLATPFLAFALAETVEGSGVLAVVVAGLAVSPEQVVQAVGWGLSADACVFAVMVVVVQPAVKGCGAFVAGAVDRAVGPACLEGADEAFGLAVGLWAARAGAEVADPEGAAGDRVDR